MRLVVAPFVCLTACDKEALLYNATPLQHALLLSSSILLWFCLLAGRREPAADWVRQHRGFMLCCYVQTCCPAQPHAVQHMSAALVEAEGS